MTHLQGGRGCTKFTHIYSSQGDDKYSRKANGTSSGLRGHIMTARPASSATSPTLSYLPAAMGPEAREAREDRVGAEGSEQLQQHLAGDEAHLLPRISQPLSLCIGLDVSGLRAQPCIGLRSVCVGRVGLGPPRGAEWKFGIGCGNDRCRGPSKALSELWCYVVVSQSPCRIETCSHSMAAQQSLLT